MNVALIDNGVAINNYTRKYVSSFLEMNESFMEFVEQTSHVDPASHGSVCAGIIRNSTDRVNLHSLKILDKNLSASAAKLIKALEWCQKNRIDIINLSLGTTNSKDFIEIRRCIKQLVSNGIIIVAAINNRGTYTIPASMPEVIGVCSHNSDDIKIIEDSIIGIDVAACSNHWISLDYDKGIHTPYCNSFAVPAVTGLLCQWLGRRESNNEVHFAETLEKVVRSKQQSVAGFSDESMVKLSLTSKIFRDFADAKIRKKVPLIEISCKNEDLSELNRLFYNDNLFPVALSGDTSIENFKKKKLYHIIQSLSSFFDCDLFFLHYLPTQLSRKDIFLRVDESGIHLTCKRRFQKLEMSLQSLKEAYQTILDLLT
ncbi:S8 family serine peptidase [Paenibacillus sabinae]|uniref:Subtilisin-like serine protease n=1 Tax=Paenibacillus sabinae T27 TaxID=1268072 RepID=X5A5C7_9BACL|nr:S8 family serine peptidase [Paenibacillus sabinae]AHV99483.1 subtilisin-like serine protease [Paenibacillus sabinae T27]